MMGSALRAGAGAPGAADMDLLWLLLGKLRLQRVWGASVCASLPCLPQCCRELKTCSG